MWKRSLGTAFCRDEQVRDIALGGLTPPLHVTHYTLTALADRDPRGTTQAAPLPEGSCHVVTEGRESFA